MTSSIHRAAVAFVILLLAAGSASARDPEEWGPYFSVDMGTTYFNVRKGTLDELSEVPTGTSSLDEGDRGYSLAAGFRISRHLAFEAAYLDLGRSSYVVEDEAGTATLGFGSRGAAVSLLGTLPINHTFALEGRAGAYFGASKMSGWIAAYFDLETGDLEALEGAGGGDPALLVGAAVVASFGGQWSLRLGYDYLGSNALAIRNEDLESGMDNSAGRLSIGIRYWF